MFLIEIMTEVPTNSTMKWINDNYPKFYEWFTLRYQQRELCLPKDDFLRHLKAIIQNHHIMLNVVELQATKLTLENIGNKTTTQNNKIQTNTLKDADSYKGYQVNGEFSIKNIEDNRDMRNDVTDYSVNIGDFQVKNNLIEFQQNYKSIEMELNRLFYSIQMNILWE